MSGKGERPILAVGKPERERRLKELAEARKAAGGRANSQDLLEEILLRVQRIEEHLGINE